jgi:hypothetical protein
MNLRIRPLLRVSATSANASARICTLPVRGLVPVHVLVFDASFARPLLKPIRFD